MNTFQQIFNDHYEEMIYSLHPRDSVIENVDKMLHCGDPSFGGAMYTCPGCRDDVLVTKFIPALEFISRLIQHIPERQFKMIRYYGIYARHREQDKKLYRVISKEKHKFF